MWTLIAQLLTPAGRRAARAILGTCFLAFTPFAILAGFQIAEEELTLPVLGERVPATIRTVEVRVAPRIVAGEARGRVFGIAVEFDYTVDGKQYTSKRYRLQAPDATESKGLRILADQLRTDPSPMCVVDPRNPELAVLHADPPASTLLGIMLLFSCGTLAAHLLTGLLTRSFAILARRSARHQAQLVTDEAARLRSFHGPLLSGFGLSALIGLQALMLRPFGTWQLALLGLALSLSILNPLRWLAHTLRARAWRQAGARLATPAQARGGQTYEVTLTGRARKATAAHLIGGLESFCADQGLWSEYHGWRQPLDLPLRGSTTLPVTLPPGAPAVTTHGEDDRHPYRPYWRLELEVGKERARVDLPFSID